MPKRKHAQYEMPFKNAILNVAPPFVSMLMLSIAFFFIFFGLEYSIARSYQLCGLVITSAGALIGVLGHLQENNHKISTALKGLRLTRRQKVGISTFMFLAYGFALHFIGLLTL
ncbi:hypothetical protein KKE06_00340 [Candidatus Micrarchaeota archaeon]|nr:hypothetical protein [Candidatus Micrarchaeota archaeon]MBU1930494.1 hypothetical protein [Candidatus Micrarchaeota archaeon]